MKPHTKILNLSNQRIQGLVFMIFGLLLLSVSLVSLASTLGEDDGERDGEPTDRDDVQKRPERERPDRERTGEERERPDRDDLRERPETGG